MRVASNPCLVNLVIITEVSHGKKLVLLSCIFIFFFATGLDVRGFNLGGWLEQASSEQVNAALTAAKAL